MPALPSVPDVIKFTIKQTIAPLVVENVCHWLFSGGTPSSAVLDTLCHDLGNAFVSHVMGLQTTEVVLTEVDAIDLTSDTSATGVYTGFDTGGAQDPPMTPVNCAMVVSLPITRRYRGGHPRQYIAGLPRAYVDDPNQWSPGAVSDMTTAYEAFQSEVNALTVSGISLVGQVNVSYYTADARRVTPLVDNIEGAVAKSRVCSQRRRLGKMGG